MQGQGGEQRAVHVEEILGYPFVSQQAATEATERLQQLLKAIPSAELLDAIIPVYQKYFTHCDIKAINEFYGTPTGQKLLKNMNAMMMDSMQPAQSVMNKYMPEIEAQIEKAGTNVPRPE